ncbi:MAG: T9SS type A sorting domain-containing protein [Bacteroidota bacterium]|nr:T9SS type A sorting domain-containing protein [Bacteroidota bacterium]
MKKIFLFLILTATVTSKAQFLNGGFENWTPVTTYMTDTLPDQWWSLNCNTVKQTTDAAQGALATRIQGFMSCGIAQGMLINGQYPLSGNIIDAGTPVFGKPGFITGFYKFTGGAAGDSAEAIVILKKFNSFTGRHDTICMGSTALPPVSVYSPFTVNIIDLAPGINPDSILVIFNSSKYYSVDTINWEMPALYIDKLSLPPNFTGIEDQNILLMQSVPYPNPASENITIQLSSGKDVSKLSIVIYDVTGKLILSRAQLSENRTVINCQELIEGTYFYQFVSESQVISSGKFTVN